MRQAILYFTCDECESEDSPPAATWSEARRLAGDGGWHTKGERALCPGCRTDNDDED